MDPALFLACPQSTAVVLSSSSASGFVSALQSCPRNLQKFDFFFFCILFFFAHCGQTNRQTKKRILRIIILPASCLKHTNTLAGPVNSVFLLSAFSAVDNF